MVQLSKMEMIKSLKNQPQIYPVIKTKNGVIIDGHLRKLANPNWKEEIIDVTDDKEILKLKFEANWRRDNKTKERREIVNELHERFGMNSVEIAEFLGISDRYVRKLLKSDVEQSTTSAIKGKSLFGLSPSNVDWCDYEITIYRGCYHNCSYCYAKKMNERFKWIQEWDKPEPKEIHWSNLKDSLDKHEKGRIFLSSASDPYQPLEAELQLTRKLLKDYLIPSKHLTLILTKSDLVRRDYDIIKGRSNIWLGMTVTSLEKNSLEPNSPSPKDRLEALKEAHSLGIKTFISIEPWIPKITNPISIVDETLEYVDFYIIGSLQYYGNEIEKRDVYISEFYEVLKSLVSNKKEFWIKEELSDLIRKNVSWNW